MYFLRAAAGPTTGISDVFPVQVLSDGTTSPSISEILVIRDESLKTYRLTGTVYDAFTGGPLEYSTVKIGDMNSSITDKAGKFFASDLLPGTYKLEITKFGYESLSASFQVKQNSSGEFSTIPATMSYPLLHDMRTGYGSIAGRYLDTATGQGIKEKYVYAYNWVEKTKTYTVKVATSNGLVDQQRYVTDWEIEGGAILTTKTSTEGTEEVPDLSGSFKFTHLAPSYYTLVFSNSPSAPGITSETRDGIASVSWSIVDSNALDYLGEIRRLKVEAGKTTYWTNYEQEYK